MGHLLCSSGWHGVGHVPSAHHGAARASGEGSRCHLLQAEAQTKGVTCSWGAKSGALRPPGSLGREATQRAHLQRSRPSLSFPVGAQCVLYLSPAWPLRYRLPAQAQIGTGLAVPAGHPAGRPVCCHPGTKSCPADAPVQMAQASQGVPRAPPPSACTSSAGRMAGWNVNMEPARSLSARAGKPSGHVSAMHACTPCLQRPPTPLAQCQGHGL